MSTMFFGTMSFEELLASTSRITESTNAMEPTLTHRLIAAKCSFIGSLPGLSFSRHLPTRGAGARQANRLIRLSPCRPVNLGDVPYCKILGVRQPPGEPDHRHALVA